MGKIRVLLADDHTVVRQGIMALLAEEPDIGVITEAGDGREAVLLAERFRPHVAVLDIAMPLLNGLEAARRILKGVPATRVILLSIYADEAYALEAAGIGVQGYLLKEAAAHQLVSAIHAVFKGDRYFAPPILEALKKPRPPKEDGNSLTTREREVWQLIAEGHANKEIAHLLDRSVNTIRNHRRRLMRKLKAHNVADLVRFAARKGVIRLQLILTSLLNLFGNGG